MATLRAVIFDQDGVLADTERDGHRMAFNRTFQEFELDIEWDVETYGGLLKVGGGKERMRQRIMHKFNYFVETYDEIACVGCGRCLRNCPACMDITKVIKQINNLK